MNILLLEDEQPAAERIKKLLKEIDSSLQIINCIESISSALQWFEQNTMPDLIISDIHLSDGLSFAIFKKTIITCPVIFCTAFDQYALDAFKANGIDYLLKPVKKEELEKSLQKFKKFFPTVSKASAPAEIDYDSLIRMISEGTKEYQKRIIIRYGDTIKAVEINDAAYFYTNNKIDYLRTFSGLEYAIDFHLDELERMLDPKQFFRINRQFIINYVAIVKMISYSKSRVKLILKPEIDQETIVSTERSPLFKVWLTGK